MERETFKPSNPHNWICWTFQMQYKSLPSLYCLHRWQLEVFLAKVKSSLDVWNCTSLGTLSLYIFFMAVAKTCEGWNWPLFWPVSLKSGCFINITMNQLGDFSSFYSYPVTLFICSTSATTFYLPLTVRLLKCNLLCLSECGHNPEIVGVRTCVDIDESKECWTWENISLEGLFLPLAKKAMRLNTLEWLSECQMVAHDSTLSQHVEFSGSLMSNHISCSFAQATKWFLKVYFVSFYFIIHVSILNNLFSWYCCRKFYRSAFTHFCIHTNCAFWSVIIKLLYLDDHRKEGF